MSTAINTKGDAYGRALQHLLVGVYIAELSLIGLFAVGGGNGPSKIMFLFFLATILYQIYMNWVLSPLLNSLSDTILRQDEEEALAQGGEAPEQPDLRTLINNNLDTVTPTNGPSIVMRHQHIGGIFSPYLFNQSRSIYPELRQYLRSTYLGTKLPAINDKTLQDKADRAYLNPSITSECPTIWLPKDDIGVSAEQVVELKALLGKASDEGAWIGTDGIVTWDEDGMSKVPIWEDRVDL